VALSPQASSVPPCDARRAVVERVLRTADELERRARSLQVGAAPRLTLVTAAGVVSAGGRSRLVLGRAPSCDVVLAGRHISRQHAALVRRLDGWWLEDLGSRNGTWCEGERVSRRRVVHGDVLELADVIVRCRLR
jgi:predicted component of type VI protein secretion system